MKKSILIGLLWLVALPGWGDSPPGKFQIIPLNDHRIILLDTETGNAFKNVICPGVKPLMLGNNGPLSEKAVDSIVSMNSYIQDNCWFPMVFVKPEDWTKPPAPSPDTNHSEPSFQQ